MINAIFLTGWLTAEPIMRVTPVTGEQRLCFDLHTHDSRGIAVKVGCFIESGALLTRIEPLLMPGRGIIVQGEYTQREVIERGRVKFIAREVRVNGCEIPNRKAATPPTGSTAGDAPTQPQATEGVSA